MSPILSDSTASCGTIQVSNEQKQVGIRKGSKTLNSTHDYGGWVAPQPGQNWLLWEERGETIVASAGGSMGWECILSASVLCGGDIPYPQGAAARRG